MGSCTSAPQQQKFTKQEQSAYNRRIMEEEELEREREVAARINREKQRLHNKALPMIQRRQSCEDVLDLSHHSDEDFEIAVRSRTSSASGDDQSDPASNSELDLALSELNREGGKEVGMNISFEKGKAREGDVKGSVELVGLGSESQGEKDRNKKDELMKHIHQQYEKDQNDSIRMLRANKQMKRRQAKLDAEADSKWMIFRDLDAFDEAEMVKVAKFMDKMMKVSGKLTSINTSGLLGTGSSSGRSSAAEPVLSLRLPTPENEVLNATPSASAVAAAEARRLLAASGDSPAHARRKVMNLDQDIITIKSSAGSSGNILVDTGTDDDADVGTEEERRSRDSFDFSSRGSTLSQSIQVPRSMSTSMIGIGSQKLSMLTAGAVSHSLDFPPAPEYSRGVMSASAPVTPLKPAESAPVSAKVTPVGTPTSASTSTIQLSRKNSSNNNIENLLYRGQVVITPTTAMVSAGKRNGPTPPSSPSTNANRKTDSTGSLSSSNANSGTISPKGSSPKEKSSVTSARSKNHAETVQKELVKNFDLQNFRLPSGFVTPIVSKAVVDVFKQGGKLSKESVHKLLRLCYRQFQTLPNTTKIALNENDRLTIVGDIHGQLADLLYIIDSSGLPSPTNRYIFNGDFVDRGAYGVEVMCVLLALYLSNPGQVTLNRGNHEDFAICCAYGFQKECCEKYDDTTFGMFVEVFNHLPLFAVINSSVFVLHGGLFHTPDVKLAELDQIRRTEFTLRDIPDAGEGTDKISRDKREDFLKQLQRDALWSDPCKKDGFATSARGAGVMFGPDIARNFCNNNNISLVVRSHECCRTGFDLPYSSALNTEDRNTVCTIFSASNYGGVGNSAAFMVFTRDKLTDDNPHDSTESGVATEGDTTPATDSGVAMKPPKRLSKTHTITSTTGVPKTDLQYEVHYFHIDSAEEKPWFGRYGGSSSRGGSISSRGDNSGNESGTDDDDDDNSVTSQLSLSGDFSLHQLILRKRALLLRHFELTDASMTGIVPKDVWAQVMQQVLSLYIDWPNMFHALVNEDSIMYPTFDRGCRIDPYALPGTTCFVQYAKFLDTFSLSLEKFKPDFDEDDDAQSDVDVAELEEEVVGAIGASGVQKNKSTKQRRQSMTGHLVDSLYAHHNELSAIFSFFDTKQDQVISREEFKAGMLLIRQLQNESENKTDSLSNATSTSGVGNSPAIADADFEQECDQLLDIMNLNGSGFIDINDFFEMFRMSDAMKKKTEKAHGNSNNYRGGQRKAAHVVAGANADNVGSITVSGKVISGA